MRKQILTGGPRSFQIPQGVAYGIWSLSLFFALLIPIFFVHGFPLLLLEKTPFRVKSLRRPFELFFIFFILGLVFHPNRRALLSAIKDQALKFSQSPWAVWFLTGIYFLLFLWQQITKVLSLEINFIPFLFYDSMLWYFDQGKFCYTGLLHGYYHVNLILLLLYPIWKLIQSPWVLHVASPLLTAGAVIPFYFWTREQIKSPLLSLVFAFVYLNFRYVQNLLHVNFVVEVFYPFLIFSAVYFAWKRRGWLYFLSVVLGLLVKEDSAIYFGILGIFFLFLKTHRKRGLGTLLLSACYVIFILKVFIPWSGSNILEGDLGNYTGLGSTFREVVWRVLLSPWLLIRGLFFPPLKLYTLFKLTSKLLFLPLFSPCFFLVIASLCPLFFQSTGQGDLFFQLSFHYTAAVLPFLFLAFVDGWRRMEGKAFFQVKPYFRWGSVTALIFLNGMNLRPFHFTRDDLKTIALAESLPTQSVVVTQGHLLPYLGYRRWNFYLTYQYEKLSDQMQPDVRRAYWNPDYFLFDLKANAYPLSPEELREKTNWVKKNPGFRLIYSDHRRFLFQKKR